MRNKESIIFGENGIEKSVPGHLGYELLRVFSLRGNFVDNVFHKAYPLTSFLKRVSSLAAGAFGCYSVLITLPLIKKNLKNKNI